MVAVIKLEKQIPIPVTARTTGMLDTMKRMAVGDSFRLPRGMNPRSPHPYAKIAKIEVTVRKQKDGYRVWRIA